MSETEKTPEERIAAANARTEAAEAQTAAANEPEPKPRVVLTWRHAEDGREAQFEEHLADSFRERGFIPTEEFAAKYPFGFPPPEETPERADGQPADQA